MKTESVIFFLLSWRDWKRSYNLRREFSLMKVVSEEGERILFISILDLVEMFWYQCHGAWGTHTGKRWRARRWLKQAVQSKRKITVKKSLHFFLLAKGVLQKVIMPGSHLGIILNLAQVGHLRRWVADIAW